MFYFENFSPWIWRTPIHVSRKSDSTSIWFLQSFGAGWFPKQASCLAWFDGYFCPASFSFKSGSDCLIPPYYLRYRRHYYLGHCSERRTKVAGSNSYLSLCRRHTFEVDSSSPSQPCRQWRPMTALGAGGVCSSVSEVYPKRYWWLCHRSKLNSG